MLTLRKSKRNVCVKKISLKHPPILKKTIDITFIEIDQVVFEIRH